MTPPRESDHSLRIRTAEPSDGPRVLWLEEVCMKDYAVALWGQWRPSSTLDSLDLSNHEMIDWNGEPKGCLATREAPEAVYLTRLYLAPDARNQGIGAQVLHAVIVRADRKGLDVRLDVLTTNPALRFYKRHGFVVERSTRERHHMIRPHTPHKED